MHLSDFYELTRKKIEVLKIFDSVEFDSIRFDFPGKF